MNPSRRWMVHFGWWAMYAAGLVALLAPMHVAAPAWAPVSVPLTGLVMLSATALAMPMVIRNGSWAVLGMAGVMHATMVLLPPLLSDDVYRYVVDGSMSRSGFTPYGWSPDHPGSGDIATAYRSQVNHPHLVTIYPPVAQALFAALAWSPTVWRACTAFGWLAGCALVMAAGHSRRANGSVGTERCAQDRGAGRSPARFAALACQLALHPLALLAVSLDGHVDAWGAMPLALVFLLWRPGEVRGGGTPAGAAGSPRRRFDGLLTAAAVALGTGVKLFPVAALAVLPGSRWWRTALLWAMFLGLATMPFAVTTGWKTLGSLGVYEQTWGYNGGLFTMAVSLVQAVAGSGAVASPLTARQLVRLAQAAFLVLLQVRWWRMRSSRTEPDAAAMAMWLTGLVWLGPTHHPWYSLWLLGPSLVAGRWAFHWLNAVAILGFWGPVCEQVGAGWRDPFWLAPAAIVMVWPVAALQARWAAGNRPR